MYCADHRASLQCQFLEQGYTLIGGGAIQATEKTERKIFKLEQTLLNIKVDRKEGWKVFS